MNIMRCRTIAAAAAIVALGLTSAASHAQDAGRGDNGQHNGRNQNDDNGQHNGRYQNDTNGDARGNGRQRITVRVPEPGTLGLFIAGVIVALGVARKRSGS